jgi:hypothetical protein
MRTVPASGVDAAAGRSAREVRFEEVPADEMSADEARRDREASLVDAPEEATGERIPTSPVDREDEATGMGAVSTIDRVDAKDRTDTLDGEETADTRRGDEPPTLTDRPVTVTRPAIGFVHTSLAASTSLFLGTAGLAAAFSGTLAPVGVVLGTLAVLCAGFGLVMAGRDRVTGHGVAVVGLLLGLAAVSVAALVMAGDLSWLHSTTDGAGKAREWLNHHFSWMRDW